MYFMDLFKRSGAGSRAAAFVSCLLLAVLLLQVLPFTFHQPLPVIDAAGDGAAHYFQPLQVCGDQQGPGGFVADIPWISPSPCTMVLSSEEQPFVTASSPEGPDGFSSPVFRPPRFSSPLT
jgi:hypothetical protein